MIIKLLILIIIIMNQYNSKIKNNVIVHKEQYEVVKNKIEENSKTQTIQVEQPIGYLKIKSINIDKPIYDINSKHNNIEENVIILKSSLNPLEESSLIILAAHSGQGKIAYFNDLDKLKIDDEIKLTYYNEEYTYKITDILIQEKNGHINIAKKDKSELILTTCSTKSNNKQLIIKSIIKES